MYIPGTTYLHILLHCTLLSHCTSYSLFYFIICFLFHSHHIYIYILSHVLFHSFYCFYVIFILLLFLFFCTFHWADLSWLTFHYLLYPVWLCMWQIIKNLEPWTLSALGLAGVDTWHFCVSNTLWPAPEGWGPRHRGGRPRPRGAGRSGWEAWKVSSRLESRI